jgi:hypothetical protein
LAGRYSGFSGCIGLAAGDTQPATLSFVGRNGRPMLFEADGQQVRSTTLVTGLPTFVTLGTVHLMNVIIRTGTAGATIASKSSNHSKSEVHSPPALGSLYQVPTSRF